jgi:hypothetical protein
VTPDLKVQGSVRTTALFAPDDTALWTRTTPLLGPDDALLEMIDRAGHRRRAEPVVNVDDGDSAGAAVQHGEQGSDAAETRAVADARRHGNDRRAHQPANHAWQRAFHAGDHDDHARRLKAMALGKKTMKTGDADVVQPIHGVAHDFGRDGRFLGDWYVRSSRRGHKDDTIACGRVSPALNDPGLFVKAGVWYDLRNGLVRARRRARHEEAVPAIDDGPRDPGDLLRRLPLAENDFREPLPDGAMVIDAGKPEVLDGVERERVQGAPFGVCRLQPAVAYGIEQRAERLYP